MPASSSCATPATSCRADGRPTMPRGIPAGWLFLAPWLIGFLGLTLGPALASLYLSFTNYDLIETPGWVGLANYARIFTADRKVADAVYVTLLYVALAVPFKLGFALAVAMLLNR